MTTQNPCPHRVSLPEQTVCENEKCFENGLMDAATALTLGRWPEATQSLAGTAQPPSPTLKSGHREDIKPESAIAHSTQRTRSRLASCMRHTWKGLNWARWSTYTLEYGLSTCTNTAASWINLPGSQTCPRWSPLGPSKPESRLLQNLMELSETTERTNLQPYANSNTSPAVARNHLTAQKTVFS